MLEQHYNTSVIKKFFSHFFVAIAAIASSFTLISTFYKIEWQDIYYWRFNAAWCWIIIITIVSVVYSCFQLRRKKSINVTIAENFKVTIKKGNIFDGKGIIVIPVDECLNTHVGDGIINPRSVHGQFIQRYFNERERIKELDGKIQSSLEKQGIIGKDIEESQFRKNAKRKKYELGTCVEISDGENKYIWVVATEYDDKNCVKLNRKDYSKVMNELFSFLETHVGDRSIYMPLIGAGNARLNCNPERILHYLIDYFDFSLSEKKLLGGVNIVIPSLKGINLNRISEIFT